MLLMASAGAWLPAAASAESTGPAAAPTAPRPSAPSAEQEYNRGLRARAAKDWTAAVGAFRKAVEIRPGFPEAWNELGYALEPGPLRRVGARLRRGAAPPASIPEALEYLGEAYVKMGRLDEARRIHERLKPLDAARALELAEVIDKARQ